MVRWCLRKAGVRVPEELNPYAPPSAPLEPEDELAEVFPVEPTTTLAKFGEACRLLVSNLRVIGPLVLTVWLPGNLLISYIAYHGPDSENPFSTLKLSNAVEGLFGPIYVAGLIHVLSKRKRGQWVTYSEAISAGYRNWGPLFVTRLTTGLMILFGLVAFVIPGITMLLKYAVVDAVVVLEGTSGSGARSRSADLTSGKRWDILAAGLLFLLILFPVSLGASSLLEQLGPFNNMWSSAAIDCCLDVLGCLITIVMFLFYWESVHCADETNSSAI
jgi:hypothetical protein